ncbi:DUF3179 domain-containing (seleno)protein [Fibrella aquatilis]|uniref:DUF3179 domain-containing protein n=1 Tax=Fibrella aquatilis TaxID=2817059 RepID=A0A939G1T4_9BACT|nr:DUF3179 domain-containing (seleno)protein [Fibrella aquatilis]MBO0929510.1 DUF3179 domain-containing protein [Fibrella aquatilis]
MNRKLLLWACVGLVALILFEAARVYFIMPFPGSQLDNAANTDRVAVAYWLHGHTTLLRVLAVLAVAYPVFLVMVKPARLGHRWLVVALLLAYAGVVYLVNTEMMADQMFQQPVTKRLVPLDQNTIPANKLVLGVVEGTEARAYPLQLVGYHHQVRDTVGGKPILITYCTVCRTGRVFDPVVGGKPETFRLVGMDHFNAMFEDQSTGSWWRQATGEAILGPRKGQKMNELAARQMTLAEWSAEHPTTLVMQPDPAFKKETDSLATYDLGVKRGKLTGRDSASWKPKSWVVGVVAGNATKAFDWNELVRKRVINGQVGTEPVLLTLAPDNLSFGTWSRTVQQKTLTFSPTAAGQFTDRETGTVWNRQGIAVSGSLMGQQLTPVRGYQEFWHSWQSFHK